MKAIGPEQLETNFGAGEARENAMRGRVPIRGTSIVQTITAIKYYVLSKMSAENRNCAERNQRGSGASDVHEFGKEVVKNVLCEVGANILT